MGTASGGDSAPPTETVSSVLTAGGVAETDRKVLSLPSEIIKLTVAECVLPPPFPVTVIGYDPGDRDGSEETVRVEVNDGLAEGTLKEEVVPAGRPDKVNDTGCETPDTCPTTAVKDTDCPGSCDELPHLKYIISFFLNLLDIWIYISILLII